jgi:E3 ubiquitin-protein ligase XIAP
MFATKYILLCVYAKSAYSLRAMCTVTGMKVRPISGPQLRINKPCFQQFSTLTDRLNSYEKWPLQQSAVTLSKAGFFYTGREDETVCFCCGGGFKDWKEYDIPRIEHLLWFKNCPYIQSLTKRQFSGIRRYFLEEKLLSLDAIVIYEKQ